VPLSAVHKVTTTTYVGQGRALDRASLAVTWPLCQPITAHQPPASCRKSNRHDTTCSWRVVNNMHTTKHSAMIRLPSL